MLSWCQRICSLSWPGPRQGWKPSYKTCSSSEEWYAKNPMSRETSPGSSELGLDSRFDNLTMTRIPNINYQGPYVSSAPGSLFRSNPRITSMVCCWRMVTCVAVDLWSQTTVRPPGITESLYSVQYSLRQRTSSLTHYCDLDPFHSIS